MVRREQIVKASGGADQERTRQSAAIFLKLMRASSGVTNRIFGQVPGFASGGQFVVLEALSTSGPMRQSDLAYKILKTTGNVTQIVDRLEADGLVTRTRSDVDRRVVLITITEKGRKKIDRAMPLFLRAVTKEFEVLTDEELQSLGYLCRKVGLGRFVSFLGADNPQTRVIPLWANRIRDLTQGLVSVSWEGGPEEIRPTEQIAAVISGEVDGAFIATSWYGPLAPELQALNLSQYTPWEERENGFFDFVARRHEAIGAIYLGRWMSSLPFYIWVNRGIHDSSEISGIRIRTRTGHADRFLRRLGAVPVSIDPRNVAAALDNAEVDGFAFSLVGPRELGWTKSIRYVIDHGFYGAQNATILMNPHVWQRLTQKQQTAVRRATAEFEREVDSYLRRIQDEERQELARQGIHFVRFESEEARKFVDGAYESIWSFLEEEVPDLVPEIQRLVLR